MVIGLPAIVDMVDDTLGERLTVFRIPALRIFLVEGIAVAHHFSGHIFNIVLKTFLCQITVREGFKVAP